jgi:hypothetical protein
MQTPATDASGAGVGVSGWDPRAEPEDPGELLRLDVRAHLRDVPLSSVPTVVTAVIIAVEISAAIRPYSIAVAPDSSFMKRENRFIEASID